MAPAAGRPEDVTPPRKPPDWSCGTCDKPGRNWSNREACHWCKAAAPPAHLRQLRSWQAQVGASKKPSVIERQVALERAAAKTKGTPPWEADRTRETQKLRQEIADLKKTAKGKPQLFAEEFAAKLQATGEGAAAEKVLAMGKATEEKGEEGCERR